MRKHSGVSTCPNANMNPSANAVNGLFHVPIVENVSASVGELIKNFDIPSQICSRKESPNLHLHLHRAYLAYLEPYLYGICMLSVRLSMIHVLLFCRHASLSSDRWSSTLMFGAGSDVHSLCSWYLRLAGSQISFLMSVLGWELLRWLIQAVLFGWILKRHTPLKAYYS